MRILGARRKAKPFGAQPEHSRVRLFSGRSWLVGVSDAPKKLRGRLHRLTDAAQAPVKRLFGLLKVGFALYLGCCQTNKASLEAATKKPRKAVPARPRAAHVRPRKSDDEWATYPYIGLPRAAQSPPEAAPLTVGCCARAPGVLLDACGAWVLFFCSLVRASRAVLVWHLLFFWCAGRPARHPGSEYCHRRWH